MTFTIHFEKQGGRSCGSCTMCCSVIPVRELRKPANTRCEHQYSKGCRIYEKRPPSCMVWSCAWLTDPSTKHLRRPDHSGYIIDIIPDHPMAVDETTGLSTTMMVTQIWVSKKNPDQWRKDRHLKEWIEASGRPAIVRVGNLRATMVVPPNCCREKQWLYLPVQLERPDNMEWAEERT